MAHQGGTATVSLQVPDLHQGVFGARHEVRMVQHESTVGHWWFMSLLEGAEVSTVTPLNKQPQSFIKHIGFVPWGGKAQSVQQRPIKSFPYPEKIQSIAIYFRTQL